MPSEIRRLWLATLRRTIPFSSPMIAVFCSSGPRRGLIVHSLGMQYDDVRVTDDWDRFKHMTCYKAQAAVIEIPELRPAAIAEMCAVRASAPHCPLIIVTSSNPNNTRFLKDISVDEVVWLDAVDGELCAAVQQALSVRSFLYRMAGEIDASNYLPPKLRAALAHACRNPEALTTVGALARQVRCGRSTLVRQWRQVMSDHPLQLEHFLDWVVLLWACQRKQAGRSWDHVADGLGSYRSTLARRAVRLTGCGLGALSEPKIPSIMRDFRVHVIAVLLHADTDKDD